MSNRVVSLTFRHIIDDVIANVRQDFEDMGIEKEVLEELQRSWEAKLVATQVTEFDGAGGAASRLGHPYTVTPGNALLRTPGATAAAGDAGASSADAAHASAGAAGTSIKTEDDANVHKRKRSDDDEGRHGGAVARSSHTSGGNAGADNDADADADGEPDPEADKDEIGSDLDDSDDDDGDGTEDMMLCLYDKVQRVKNKWKCVLRDGVASIGGRDYLFSKCNGCVRATSNRSEFEW